jgi:hypothetical protein
LRLSFNPELILTLTARAIQGRIDITVPYAEPERIVKKLQEKTRHFKFDNTSDALTGEICFYIIDNK